jgi:HAMP domain-containing protein
MDLNSLRIRLFALLPTLLIALIMIGNAMFCSTSVLPAWRTYEALSTEVAAGKATVESQLAAPLNEEMILVQRQVEMLGESLATAASPFLSDLQLDELINSLYRYADLNNVTISSLQAQQPPISPDMATPAYNTRQFRVQVEGDSANLMKFITRIRETTLTGFVVNNLNLVDAQPRSSLNFDLQIYTSPYSSGEVLASLISTTEVMPTVAPVTPLAVEVTQTPVPASSVVIPQSIVSGTTSAPVMPISCEGAPTPRFSVGELVVVDFNGEGALRVMYRVNGSAMDTPVQVYDNEFLHLLAGPVCGSWNGTNIWYWYVNVNNVQGWVGEGTQDDPWLCALSNPECGQ